MRANETDETMRESRAAAASARNPSRKVVVASQREIPRRRTPKYSQAAIINNGARPPTPNITHNFLFLYRALFSTRSLSRPELPFANAKNKAHLPRRLEEVSRLPMVFHSILIRLDESLANGSSFQELRWHICGVFAQLNHSLNFPQSVLRRARINHSHFDRGASVSLAETGRERAAESAPRYVRPAR